MSSGVNPILIAVAEIPFGLEDLKYASVNHDKDTPTTRSDETMLQCVLLYQRKGAQPFVLISGDIIWFPSTFCDSLRAQVTALVGTEIANVVVSATHTHGTLNPDPDFSYGGSGGDISDYLFSKMEQLLSMVLAKDPVPISISYGMEMVDGISVNRRKLLPIFRPKPGFRAQSFPNPKRGADNRLHVIVFKDADTDKALAVLTRFTCHPVADVKSCLGADFPGVLKRKLKAMVPGNPYVLFLQGFCGDVRPNHVRRPEAKIAYLKSLILGRGFRASEPHDSNHIGTILADLSNALVQNAEPLTVDKDWTASVTKIPLVLESGRHGSKEIDVTVWHIGSLIFGFVSGEILSGFTPDPSKDTQFISVGYTNGMVGYLPLKKDKWLGGYEIDGSRKYFGLQSRVSDLTCDTLRESLRVSSS
jgi:hypothetical protein